MLPRNQYQLESGGIGWNITSVIQEFMAIIGAPTFPDTRSIFIHIPTGGTLTAICDNWVLRVFA
jgi:hypothetical protein